MDFIELVNMVDGINIFGYAITYDHYLEPGFSDFESRIKHQIYFHGQNQESRILSVEQISDHNEKGYYFFI